jgi:glycosyltransferase involved in cell wall biosynthesis
MTQLLLSVVIPSFNSEKYIEETLLSIRRNQHPSVEYLLLDGGSSDRTMEIVEKYRELFSVVISEPDNGQSDAFNKGFKLAQGEYLTWLNSDDVFCPGAVAKVIEYIKQTRKSWYAANMLYIDANSEILRCCQSGRFEGWALRFAILNVFGPSTIFHRDLFSRFGGFNEEFHFCMDTEFWWRIASHGIEFQRIPTYLWALRLHDEAKTASAVTGQHALRPARMQEEGAEIWKTYSSSVSRRKRKFGTMLVRLYRILNGSYVLAMIETIINKNKNYSKLKLCSDLSPRTNKSSDG